MTLDQCAEISRDLVESERLDELVEGEFNLEISSPGLDRPLRTAEHFRQQVGQKAKVELVEAVDQRKAGSGIITAVSSEGIIEIATTRGAWRFDAAKVDAANVIYQWPENNKPSNNRVH
jgi:ribosome maturation factor RimP